MHMPFAWGKAHARALLLFRLTNTQFSREELKAIVEEAESAGTYV
jgi:imidazolonepropionase-like amidohydrolase